MILSQKQLKQIAKQIKTMEQEAYKAKEDKAEAKRQEKVCKDFRERKDKNYKGLVRDLISQMIHTDYYDETEDGLDEHDDISMAYHMDQDLYLKIYNIVENIKDEI